MILARNGTSIVYLAVLFVLMHNLNTVNVFGYLVLQVVIHGKVRVVQAVVGAKVVAKDTIVVVEIGAVTILEEATSRITVVDQ